MFFHIRPTSQVSGCNRHRCHNSTRLQAMNLKRNGCPQGAINIQAAISDRQTHDRIIRRAKLSSWTFHELRRFGDRRSLRKHPPFRPKVRSTPGVTIGYPLTEDGRPRPSRRWKREELRAFLSRIIGFADEASALLKGSLAEKTFSPKPQAKISSATLPATSVSLKSRPA